MFPKSYSLFTAVLLTIFMIGGCGGSFENGLTVSGNVTLDGNPLQQGTVSFINSQGVPAGVGMIKDGNFEVVQSANIKGLPAGSYKVSVESWESEPGAEMPDGSFSAGKLAIPEKYTNYKTSGLTVEVGDVGNNNVLIELKSK